MHGYDRSYLHKRTFQKPSSSISVVTVLLKITNHDKLARVAYKDVTQNIIMQNINSIEIINK